MRPGEAHDALVVVRARNQDLDGHAAAGGLAKAFGEAVVGHEVGAGDAQALMGQEDQRLQQRWQRPPAVAALRGDDQGGRQAGAFGRRGDVPVVDDRVACLGPVLGERGLQAVDSRAADADVGVAPFAGVAGVALPLLGDADAAGEPDLVVARRASCGACAGRAGRRPSAAAGTTRPGSPRPSSSRSGRGSSGRRPPRRAARARARPRPPCGPAGPRTATRRRRSSRRRWRSRSCGARPRSCRASPGRCSSPLLSTSTALPSVKGMPTLRSVRRRRWSRVSTAGATSARAA